MRIKHLLIQVSFFLLLVFSPLWAFGDGWKFFVGYGLSRFGSGMHNFDNEIYRLGNLSYPNLTDKPQNPGMAHGAQVGFGYFMDPEDRFYITWDWTNRHMVAKGGGKQSSSGTSVDYRLKIRHNNFSLATVGFRLKPWIGLAFAPVEIGTLKVLYKNNVEEGFDRYNDYYNVEKGLLSDYTTYGYSVSLDFFLSKFRLRAQVYRSWNQVGLRSRKDIQIEYKYNATQASLSLAYMLGKSN
jgi:hypothetical protein